jgi:small subunit ribosomal protein S17
VEKNAKTPKKTNEMTGVVVSDKMMKTVTVAVTTRKLHPLYKKYIMKTKKVKAHDEKNEAHSGDTVRIVETRPISKDKHWKVAAILERAR